MASYTLNPTDAQASIVEYLESLYSHIPVIPDGLLDTDDDTILRYKDESIKPFIVLRFYSTRRSRRGRSFSSEKLDSHHTGFDTVVVARSGTEARLVLNSVSDSLIGFKPEGSGGIVKGEALWEGSRAIINSNDKPTRWAATDRFIFGVSAVKIPNPAP